MITGSFYFAWSLLVTKNPSDGDYVEFKSELTPYKISNAPSFEQYFSSHFLYFCTKTKSSKYFAKFLPVWGPCPQEFSTILKILNKFSASVGAQCEGPSPKNSARYFLQNIKQIFCRCGSPLLPNFENFRISKPRFFPHGRVIDDFRIFREWSPGILQRTS